MECSQLILSLRLLMNDMVGARYSDHQLILFLNLAISMIYDQLIGYANSLAKKTATLTMADGSAQLPEDFHSLSLAYHDSEDTLPDYGVMEPEAGYYKIVGDRIYSGDEDLDIEYFYVPAKIETIDDEVDIPRMLEYPIIAVANAMSIGDRMTADTIILRTITATASRGIAYIPDRKPFE